MLRRHKRFNNETREHPVVQEQNNTANQRELCTRTLLNKSLKITVLRSECTYRSEREPDGLFSNDLHQLGPVARAFIYFQDIADSRSIKFVLNYVRLQRTSLLRFQTVRECACWDDDGFI